jgi:hypothetical protein
LARTLKLILSCWRSTALFKGSQPKVGSEIFDGSVGIQGRTTLESALCTDNFEQLDVKTLVKLPVHIFRRLIHITRNYEETMTS